MEAGNGCGHNSTTSEIFTSFDANHSRYGGFFAEYYSALHEANVAISTHDPNADASAAAAAVARERAMAWVHQKDFNPAMLIPPDAILKFSQTVVSLGKEAVGLAAGILLNPNSSNDWDGDEWVGGTEPMNKDLSPNYVQNPQAEAARRTLEKELKINIPKEQWHRDVTKQGLKDYQDLLNYGYGIYDNR